METLFRSFRTQLEHTSTEVVRFLHDQIAWDSRLVAILGARGVGKTTLLLQHIKCIVGRISVIVDSAYNQNTGKARLFSGSTGFSDGFVIVYAY